MNEKYFLVSKYPDDVNPTDIAFEPVAKEKVPDDFLSFKTDIEKVLKTINVLYENEVQKKKSLIEQVFFAAQVCYSGSESDYAIARQALEDIKNNILSSSWITVRNKVIIRFGIVTLIGFFIFSLSAWLFHNKLNNLPFLLMGTCLGALFSVSVKVNHLEFDDILLNVSELKSPVIKFFICCLVSIIAFLFLSSGIIEIKLGDVSTAMIPDNNYIAIAVGVIFGVGESTLASKITDKANKALT